jgi:nickel/cobalt transporter (NicO) family protein
MPSFADVLQQGTAHAWLFIPSAILLGALHGLEPGHSKTMMAAFIVAIRGTVEQAALLGVAATISHTIVVWAIALGGMYLWQGVNTESLEPYFQLASALIIIAVALWMLRRTWQDQRRAKAASSENHHRMGAQKATARMFGASIPAMASSLSRSPRMACRRAGASRRRRGGDGTCETWW